MNTVRYVRAAALCALVLDFAAYGVEIDSPWAWWKPDPASVSSTVDATGGGHTLTHGQDGFLPQMEDPLRGNHYACAGTGGNNAQFSCPVMKSRTFALWFEPSASQHGYTAYTDIDCLLNNLSGMTIYSRHAKNILRVAFGKLSKDQFEDTTSDLSVRTSISVPMLNDTWQHLVFSLEDTGSTSGDNTLYDLSVYLDGELFASETGIAVPNSFAADTAVIGNVGGYSRSPYSGNMDDIRVYTNAFSAAEAKELFVTSKKVRLLGHWPMERIDVGEGGLRTTPDISGNDGPLVLGSLAYLTNGISGAGALFFNAGTVTSANEPYDSYALASNRVATIGGDATITMWIKRDKGQSTANGARLIMFTNHGLAGKEVSMLIPEPGTGSRYLKDNLNNKQIDDCIVQCEGWSHLALVFQPGLGPIGGDNSVTGTVYRVIAYINGEKVHTSAWGSTEISASLFLKHGLGMRLANYSTNIRPFRGTLDDVRWYAGRLTDEEIRAIYRGPAKVVAGADFSVAGEAAEISCEVSPFAANPVASGFAGGPVWTLVSAPTGGDAVTIANPNGCRTSVTLPVLGNYVFAVSNEVAGISDTDMLTVSRVADMSEAPAVTASVLSQTGLCAVVAATVPTGAHVSWTKVSGPGAAWFGHGTSAKTVATFSAAGTYMLRCTVRSGGALASADVEVSVSGPAIAEQLSHGLGAYWPFSLDSANDDKLTQFKDRVSNRVMKNSNASFDVSHGLGTGVGGGYGIRLPSQSNGYLLNDSGSAYKLSEGSTTVDGKTVPQEPFTTMSVWMYHDSSDANNVWMATLLCCNYMMAFHYHCDGGAANDFEIASTDPSVTVRRCRWKGPSGVNFTNRWVHVVMQLDQHNGGESEVWVNGEKLTEKTGNMPTYQRYYDRGFTYGGGSSYDEDDIGANTATKKFPGKLDELRMYRRKLTEAEIRYLYEYPSPEHVNQAPDVTIPLSSLRFSAVRTTACPIDATAFDDGLPLSGSQTCKWTVVSGDASALEFSDASSAATTVTATKVGTYTLQLVVSDGERTQYSDPIVFTATPFGMAIIFK